MAADPGFEVNPRVRERSRTKRRVLMVLDEPFPPDARVENEARSLARAGFDVTVLAVAPDQRPAGEDLDGIRVVRDRISRFARDKMRGLAGTVPLLTWYLARRIRKVHREHPFDVLHVHDLYLFGGGPVVGDLHENWVAALQSYAWSTRFPGRYVVSIPRWERLERRWVNAVDRLIVVIEEAAERNRALGVPPDRITVVPNTVDLDAFDAFAVDEALVQRFDAGFTVLYTGGFDVHRGLASVIRAMPRVRAAVPAARLVLVGDGRIRGELETLADALGLRGAVLFEGWQPQARLKSYIQGSDVCLVPHLKTPHTDATIPHKLFHYMHGRRPVVVSDCRPLRRIVEGTGAGLVYPAGDADALAAAILEVAADPERARTMGECGHRAVRDRYNWETTTQGLIGMYHELASTG